MLQVELVEVENPKESYLMSTAEKFETCEAEKAKGNDLFKVPVNHPRQPYAYGKSGNQRRADNRREHGVDTCPWGVHGDRGVVWVQGGKYTRALKKYSRALTAVEANSGFTDEEKENAKVWPVPLGP